jgi:hypothetical protein
MTKKTMKNKKWISNYRVGDKVKIVANESSHGFEIGEIVIILEVDEKSTYIDGGYTAKKTQKLRGDSSDWWFVGDFDLEIPTKS